MKRLFKLLLSLTLMITVLPSFNIKANNEINYNRDNFTEEEIEMIEELVNTPGFDASEGELISVSRQRTYIEEPSNARAGTISSSAMDMTIYVFKLTQSGYDAYRLVGKADWLSAPLVRATDAILLSWSDDFSLYSHSCTTAYNSMGVLSGKSALIDAPPEQGVGYNVDCSYNYGQALDYVLLNAYVRKFDDGTNQTANVMAKYAHATLTANTGFSIVPGDNGYLSFEPNVIGTYDIAVEQEYFEY